MERMMIHEIPGFSFGQVQDLAAGTGCTVILCPEGGVTGVDVRGGSPGTRDTDALNPVCNREVVHAVVLTGGSAFGLDAAGGVMKKLEEVGVGRDVMVTVVPNVCAAVLFDLKFGSMEIRPDGAMGYAACEAALRELPFQEGNFGAGTGCTIGKIRGAQFSMKGGIGACAFRQGDLMVGAVVACTVKADLLVLLSDIQGLYTADPRKDPGARLIPVVEEITADIEALAGGAGSGLGTGGMATKLRAARMVTGQGCDMIITNGDQPQLLYDIVEGKQVGTRFLGRRA